MPTLNALSEPSRNPAWERMILFGEGPLRRAIQEFVMHYHYERNHQGLGNRLILEEEPCAGSSGAIQRRQRLGGMLNYYYREAA
jgi:putative transposase